MKGWISAQANLRSKLNRASGDRSQNPAILDQLKEVIR